ncbi:FMN-dependent NADH-azoreductase [Oceanobacillus piezotolerans]|uniref:FMN dependent NADH:quinone oxidoreductase n=1 Tax=Oceanobacillus piezotolerans TaxID=2448030 RepID=A0A498DBR7_9BACI|nr:NAD(P)H-dependent oxidoreductase [Oceanobacillus piezotolerans]RLL45480.1 FMN-dependent NADH-azoreductase [Oceanobacillus piezotolerans]
MKRTLIINAHPRVDSEDSISLKVGKHLIKSYRKSGKKVIHQINLYQDYVPAIDGLFLKAYDNMENGIALEGDEEQILHRMAEIVMQFKQTDRYVIVMPLHNWNIPSKLKDYMDNIILPRETFQYRKDGGIEGLLTGDRSVLVIQASDNDYSNNDWNTDLEFSHYYLQAMFQLLGINNYHIIRAQGNAIYPTDQILMKAYKEAEAVAKDWIAEDESLHAMERRM